MKEAVHDLYLQGKHHFNHGDYDKARECLEMVLSHEPDLAEVHGKLGVIYHADGKFRKASPAFRRAIEIKPSYTEAALNLVISLNESGRFEEAEEVFRRAARIVQGASLSVDPFVRGKITGMHVETGDAYMEIGWFNEAIQEFGMALKLRPESTEVLTKLGLAHREKGEMNEAVHYLNRARSLNPGHIPVLLHLGLTYYRQGRMDLAIEEWNAAKRMDPECREAAVFLRLVDDSGNAGTQSA